jgi:hypothetical protein
MLFSFIIIIYLLKIRPLGKAEGAGVRLPEQKSSAYRVDGEVAQRARPQGKLAGEIAALNQPSQSGLKLYSQLKKAESSALF